MADPDQVRGKLARAIFVIDDFQRAEADFILTRATEAKSDEAGGMIISMKPIPESLSAIAGDALQDIRSALDHEVHRMAVTVKGKGWSGLGECAFPIYRNEGGYLTARQAMIGGIPDAVQGLIDAMQLFRHPRDAETDSLELLHELARVDRHRLLHLTVIQATELSADIVPLADVVPSKVIGEVTPATKGVVQVRMKMRLSFLEAPAESAPVGETLMTLATAVKRVIRRMRTSETA